MIQRNTLLIVMVAAGSAMCWWPQIIPPNLDRPGWKTPLILIALITGLATVLSSEGWRWLLIASFLGVFGGICCGFWLWWPADSIDAPLVPFAIGLATLISIPVSMIAVFAGVALRDSKIATENRRLLWAALLVSFAFAPIVCALTPRPNHPPKVIQSFSPKRGILRARGGLEVSSCVGRFQAVPIHPMLSSPKIAVIPQNQA